MDGNDTLKLIMFSQVRLRYCNTYRPGL